jgi:hypothetical protein
MPERTTDDVVDTIHHQGAHAHAHAHAHAQGLSA